jgi:hypothetical protein
MKNSPLYSHDDIQKVNDLVNEGRKRIRVDKYVGGGSKNSTICDDNTASNSPYSALSDTVPEGWKIKTFGPGKSTEIVAPDGASFESRSAGLRHMILSGYSPEEQEEMRGHLRHEGWTDSPLIPAGWKIIFRSEDEEEDEEEGSVAAAGGEFTFLTPTGETLDSIEAAVEYLTDSGGERKEEIKRLQQLREKESTGTSRMGTKYDWEDDPTVPAGRIS